MHDEQFAIVIWMNPEAQERPQTRLLETITAKNNKIPVAFPIRILQLSLSKALLVSNETILDHIMSSSRENPLIVPLSVAAESLGWTEFDINDGKGD